MHALGNCF